VSHRKGLPASRWHKNQSEAAKTLPASRWHKNQPEAAKTLPARRWHFRDNNIGRLLAVDYVISNQT